MRFLPGLEVSRALYDEAVGPALRGREHAAGLIDGGSEVLGFDTARSMDHDWGPRLQIFLPDGAGPTEAEELEAVIGAALPPTVRGIPARLADPEGLRHGVTVVAFGTWVRGHFGFDPRAGLSPVDWLGVPGQLLAVATGGAIFHDGLGPAGPTALRERLAWYPDDVHRYLLAAQWTRIGQEEPFVGRCGEVGDELGSAVIAARLARDHMRLAMLLARRYPPYPKWFGTAFARTPGTQELSDQLRAALTAPDWPTRERHLVAAARINAAATNASGLAAREEDPTPRPFYDRPFTVLDGERFAAALRDAVTDPAVRALPPTGAVDQWVDSTDVLSHATRARDVTRALNDR